MGTLKKPIRFTADILTTNNQNVYEVWYTPKFVSEYTGINLGIVDSYFTKIKNKNNKIKIENKWFYCRNCLEGLINLASNDRIKMKIMRLINKNNFIVLKDILGEQNNENN